MGKWWMGAVVAAAWLGASAAADAQVTPMPATAPPAGDAGTAPGGFLPPPPQGNFSVHPPPAAGGAPPSPPNGFAPAPPPGGACEAGPNAPEVGPSAFTGDAEPPPPNAFNCPADRCGPEQPYHIGLEYLGWRTRKMDLPTLATTGSFGDPIPGALGQPNTLVVFGRNDESDGNSRNGVRLTFEVGLDQDVGWTLDGSAFLLGRGTDSWYAANDGAVGNAVLTRPFFNVVSGVQDADPVALPGIASGNLKISTSSQFYGTDLNLRYHYSVLGDRHRFEFLLGASFLSLDDGLRIQENSQDLPGLGVPGNTYFLSEDFVTHNRFYGGQTGAQYELRLGRFTADFVGKVAIGPVLESVHNSPFTSITEPNGIVTTSSTSALYISPNNAGDFHRTHFAVAPEANVKAGFDIFPNVRLTVGYTFLYLSSVARAGDQVNPNVNVQPVGGPAFAPLAPPPTPQSTSFWAQGVDAGILFSF